MFSMMTATLPPMTLCQLVHRIAIVFSVLSLQKLKYKKNNLTVTYKFILIVLVTYLAALTATQQKKPVNLIFLHNDLREKGSQFGMVVWRAISGLGLMELLVWDGRVNRS